jgi:hypothetical protein
MRVKLDGNVVPSALLDSEVPADPGEHSIEVTAPGFLRSASRLSVSEGEKRSVSLTLARDPNAAVAAPTAAPAPTSGATPVAASRAAEPAPAAPGPRAAPVSAPNRTAAYVSLGIGVAGIAAGGALGYLTLTKKSSLQEQCPGDVCAQSQQGELDAAKRMGTLSTIAFGVGGVGLVLGTVLFVTAAPHDQEQDHARVTPKPRFAGLSQPRVAIGPTHVELSADF